MTFHLTYLSDIEWPSHLTLLSDIEWPSCLTSGIEWPHLTFLSEIEWHHLTLLSGIEWHSHLTLLSGIDWPTCLTSLSDIEWPTCWTLLSNIEWPTCWTLLSDIEWPTRLTSFSELVCMRKGCIRSGRGSMESRGRLLAYRPMSDWCDVADDCACACDGCAGVCCWAWAGWWLTSGGWRVAKYCPAYTWYCSGCCLQTYDRLHYPL